MSKFYVGQRVRVLSGAGKPHCQLCDSIIGALGTIIERREGDFYSVEIDGILPDTDHSFGGYFQILSIYLWPVDDDKRYPVQQETTTWDKCVWQPTGVRA